MDRGLWKAKTKIYQGNIFILFVEQIRWLFWHVNDAYRSNSLGDTAFLRLKLFLKPLAQ